MRGRGMHTGLKLHLGLFFAFLYVPVLVLMVLSFNRAGLPTVWTGFSLEWYGKLFSADPICGVEQLFGFGETDQSR